MLCEARHWVMRRTTATGPGTRFFTASLAFPARLDFEVTGPAEYAAACSRTHTLGGLPDQLNPERRHRL